MPLPKAPTKPADILEDYGAPAEPEEVRRPTRAQRPQQALEAEAAAAPAPVAKVIGNYLGHCTGNPCTISQKASAVALAASQETVDEMKKAFDERRKYFVERVKNIPGVSCLEPDGAFYIFMNIKELLGKTIKGVKINNSSDFATAFLEKGLVAVVPGVGLFFEWLKTPDGLTFAGITVALVIAFAAVWRM